MQTIRRFRNLAFLSLVVAVALTSQAKLSADSSGGFYCGYGDCTLTYDNCQGSWDAYYYPDNGAPSEPGDCMLVYHVALVPEPGDTCYIHTDAQGSVYHWPLGDHGCEESACGQGTCWYCACVMW